MRHQDRRTDRRSQNQRRAGRPASALAHVGPSRSEIGIVLARSERARSESAFPSHRSTERAMKTDELIGMLSTNVEPVDLRRPWRTLTLAVAIGIVLAACVMMLALGVRPDLLNARALV